MSYTNRSRTLTFGGRPRNGRGPARPAKRGGKDVIHPSRFIQRAKPVAETVPYVPTHMFSDFVVAPVITKNIAQMGFTQPSPIQDQTIPAGLQGSDIVGIANTGTGKTAAFAIPVLQRLLDDPSARALILAPTRELAQQIEEQCRAIGRGSGLRGAVLIGGVNMRPQLRDLKANPQIVIGTPGRVKDHADQRTLDLSGFTITVLDEVDRMLDMGFIQDIREILGRTAKERQSFYFSATLDARVRAIIDGFAKDPIYVTVKTGETSDTVDQDVVTYAGSGEKMTKLHDALIQEGMGKALVFDDTQRSVERLSKELQLRGFAADAIHGGKTQSQRQKALDKFRSNQVKILVATDVAARGIDVSDITHVINFSTPRTYDDYVHRIGRAGRAGQQGFALTFIAK